LSRSPDGALLIVSAGRQAYDRAEMRFRISTDSGTSHFAANDVQKEAAHSDTASVFENCFDASYGAM
jgi:hypothetical protein